MRSGKVEKEKGMTRDQIETGELEEQVEKVHTSLDKMLESA